MAAAGGHVVIVNNWLLTNTRDARILRTMNMKQSSVDRQRYVTSRYSQLQGARLVPLSLVFFASALWRAGGLRLPGDQLHYGPQAWFLAGIAAAIFASYGIRRWYTRSVGAVGQHATRSAAIPILGSCVLVVLAIWLQGVLQWRLSLPALAIAAVLLVTGLTSRGYRAHYIAAAGVLFTFSVVPVFGVGLSALEATLDAVIGLVLLITGVGDHRLLTRTMPPPAEGLA